MNDQKNFSRNVCCKTRKNWILMKACINLFKINEIISSKTNLSYISGMYDPKYVYINKTWLHCYFSAKICDVSLQETTTTACYQ